MRIQKVFQNVSTYIDLDRSDRSWTPCLILKIAVCLLVLTSPKAFGFVSAQPPRPVPNKQNVIDMRDTVIWRITVLSQAEEDKPPKVEPDAQQVAQKCIRENQGPEIPPSILQSAKADLQLKAACFKNAMKGIWDSTGGFAVDVCKYLGNRVVNPTKVQQDLAAVWSLFDYLGMIATEAVLDPETVVGRVGDQCYQAYHAFSELSPSEKELVAQKASLAFCEALGNAGGSALLASWVGKAGTLSAAAKESIGAQFKQFIKKTLAEARQPRSAWTAPFQVVRNSRDRGGSVIRVGQLYDNGGRTYLLDPNALAGKKILNTTLDTIMADFALFAQNNLGRFPSISEFPDYFMRMYAERMTPFFSRNVYLNPGGAPNARRAFLDQGMDLAQIADRGMAMCAENAFTAANGLHKLGFKDVYVVGGQVFDHTNQVWVGHAWNEIGDKVYDVQNKVMGISKADYYNLLRVQNTTRVRASEPLRP